MITINYKTVEREDPVKLPENLLFGRMFTDHMFDVTYEKGKGWINPEIKKNEEMSISPAAMVFHYGQAIFEGLKAYLWDDGRIALFRADQNIERFNRSAKRLCMPEIDPELMLEAIKAVVKTDKDWIPKKPGYSLYIRPFMVATDPYIGVRPSEIYKMMIILSPVGPYYPQGFKPVPILVTEKFARAVKKGIGECKAAANYAASLMGQVEAYKEGYTQVLWLDAIEQKYIEEVGTMNIFIQFKDEVATPRLSGSILPGVTRSSVIRILKDWDYNVTERDISIMEIIERYKKGEVVEIFGTGTAAVISSVSRLKYTDFEMKFSDEEAGELGTKLYNEISGIQNGKIEDRYKWITFID